VCVCECVCVCVCVCVDTLLSKISGPKVEKVCCYTLRNCYHILDLKKIQYIQLIKIHRFWQVCVVAAETSYFQGGGRRTSNIIY